MSVKRLLCALVVAGTALALPAGAAPTPNVVDPAGDAGPLTAVSNQGGVASVAAYDIRAVTFARGPVRDTTVVTLQLGAPPVDLGYYVVSFDVPGCAGGYSPRPEPEGKRTYRAFRLIYSHLAGPVQASSLADCQAVGPNKNATFAATTTVSGSAITWTVPTNAVVKPGVRLTGPVAFTATAGTGVVDTYMDIAGPGRDYVVYKSKSSKIPPTPVSQGGRVTDPAGDTPVAGLDILRAQLHTRLLQGKKELVATLDLAGDAQPEFTNYRMTFDLPGCSNGSGTGVVLTYDGLYTRAAGAAYLTCQVTLQTIRGSFVLSGKSVEVAVPYGGIVRTGAKAVRVRGSSLFGAREMDSTEIASDLVLG